MKNIKKIAKKSFWLRRRLCRIFQYLFNHKKLDLSLLLNYEEINDKIKEIKKYSVENELYEKCF